MGFDRLRAKVATTLLGVTLLFATGCGAPAAPSALPDEGQEPVAEEESISEDEARDAEYRRALSAEGLVTSFIGEQFYDKAVEDEEDALAAVESVVSDIGVTIRPLWSSRRFDPQRREPRTTRSASRRVTWSCMAHR